MLHAVEQKKIYIYIFHPVVRNLKLNQHSKHFVKTANKILHTKSLLNVYMQMGTYALNYKKPTETSRRLYFAKLLTAKLCHVKVLSRCFSCFYFFGLWIGTSVPSRNKNTSFSSVHTVTDSIMEFHKSRSNSSKISPHCRSSSKQRRICSFLLDCARISFRIDSISSSAFLHSVSSSEKRWLYSF